jgi:phenylacetate-CoA ligase
MREVQSRASWGEPEIRAYQEERLRALIRYCWDHVPYYRSRWKSVISGPEDVQRIEDLQRLPIVTKDEFREEIASITTTHPEYQGQPARTGGSTGRPILFRMTKDDEELAWAQMYVGWTWAGWRLGAPFLVVGGESVGINLGDRRSRNDRIVNRWVTSGSNLTPDRTKVLAASPQFRRIEFIYGYPNAIRELGELLSDLKVRPPRLRGVVCTAEVMRPEVRQRISETFGGVPVRDQYGLNDGGLLAVEGPETDGLHLFFHRGILEVLDEQNRPITGLGLPGRAVATTITNYATPFVRYETGDDVHWKTREPAASGIAWPRIGPVDGRTGDVIFLPSGRRIAMPGLTLVMRWMESLRTYQFIQTGQRAVTARLEKGPGFRLSDEEIVAYLKARIADEIEWTVVSGPPELTRNEKVLVIRNDWLRNQGLTRPPSA